MSMDIEPQTIWFMVVNAGNNYFDEY